MTVEALVHHVVIAEAIGAVVLITVLLLSGSRRRSHESRRAATRAAVGRMVTALFNREQPSPDDVSLVGGSRSGDIIRAITEYAPSVGGGDRAVLANVADIGGLLKGARRQLTSWLWWRRLEAARLLTLLGADEAEVVRMIRDKESTVRAQGAAAAAAWPFAGAPRILVGMMRDTSDLVRFEAMQAIVRLGSAGTQVVFAELRSDAFTDGTGLRSLLELAAAIATPDVVDIGQRFSTSADPAIRCAAAKVLAAAGGEAAGSRLVEMLSDENAEVRRTVAKALGVMGDWRASAALGERLDDESHEVRIAAASALQRLGAPGTLMLRRAMTRTSERAAAVARQTLDAMERLALDRPV
jgi:HEAT repeat protein